MIAKLLLPGGLAFIMFALGLTLQMTDFTRVIKRPFAILLGLFCQLLLLPVLAFALLHLWPVDPLMAVGVMILAASPGGITSNLITHFARGDTALSISLTAISSLAGLVTIPLIVGFSLNYFSQFHTRFDSRIARIRLSRDLCKELFCSQAQGRHPRSMQWKWLPLPSCC